MDFPILPVIVDVHQIEDLHGPWPNKVSESVTLGPTKWYLFGLLKHTFGGGIPLKQHLECVRSACSLHLLLAKAKLRLRSAAEATDRRGDSNGF